MNDDLTEGTAWSRRFFFGLIVLLIIAAVLPYSNTLLNGFVYDDNSQILLNPYVRSFRYLPKIFVTAVWAFTGMPSRYYRPVMTFGYLLCYKAFGFSPAAFHLVNIILHAMVVCLLFLLTRRMFGNRLIAFASAAIFVLHPIHTESVAWISGVTDLELTFFYLLTFWFLVSLGRLRGRRLVWAYLGMTGSFAVALLSKEQAVTLPVLALLYEHFYRDSGGATSWRMKWLRHFPLWLLTALYIPLRWYSVGGFVVTSNYWSMTIGDLLFTSLSLTGQYLWKLFWPIQLSAFYVFDQNASTLNARLLWGILAVILMSVAFWRFWKHARLVSFGLLWFIITLGPVLNPKWLGVNVFAERYLYLPSVGFCWVVAWAIQSLWRALAHRRTVWRQVVAASVSLVCLFWSWRIVTRNSDWHDDVRLYTQTLAVSPNATLIRANLATIYKNEGLLQQAESEYREALEHDPDCSDCWNSLGALFIEERRYGAALQSLARAIQLKPNLLQAHLNLGILYQNTDRLESARREFLEAARIAPRNPRIYSALASYYLQIGDSNQAEVALKRALELDPYDNRIRMSLAKLYEAANRPDQAIREYGKVLETEPANPEVILAIQSLKSRERTSF